LQDAEHEETSPHASHLLISKLVCSLVGQEQTISILPGSLAYQAYQQETAKEKFHCNYGLNPAYQAKILEGKLKVSGIDDNGEVRIIELPGHPFFIATLFLPQLSSSPGSPHPLLTAYLKAGLEAWSARNKDRHGENPAHPRSILERRNHDPVP
jgi:CTP synthase (UTP-ammonia lyase)